MAAGLNGRFLGACLRRDVWYSAVLLRLIEFAMGVLFFCSSVGDYECVYCIELSFVWEVSLRVYIYESL